MREYERLVLFTLGRLVGARGPGIVFVLPFVNRVNKVDLRERYLEVPHQTCITKDNAPTDIDFLIYYKVVDAAQSIVQVQNFTGASVGIATTTLRAVVGDIPLDELLAKRDQINSILRTKLDEVTERWGIKVTNVEIREIRPPKDVQESMVKQMSAERTRRAMVLEADGKRESTILVAEGDKKSAILKAEGDKQAVILRAQGYAESLSVIYGAGQDDRRQDHDAAVPGHAEDDREQPLHQVHHPRRVHGAPQAPQGADGRRRHQGLVSPAVQTVDRHQVLLYHRLRKPIERSLPGPSRSSRRR